MISPDHRSSDQLDLLIQQALAESVANEEPPAHIWDRIRAVLTEPERPSTVRWSGVVLQAALLFLILVFGGTLVSQVQLVERSPVTSFDGPSAVSLRSNSTDYSPARFRTSRVWTLTVYGDDSPETSAKGTRTAMDAAELAFLRRYSSSRTSTSGIEESRRSASGIGVPAGGVPPDLTSLQAKVVFLRSLREVEPAERETEPAEQPVYVPGPM